jgi:hypothetical protein
MIHGIKVIPDYLPFIVTPCFPSFPSNYGSRSKGADVLRRLYGDAGHSITMTNPADPSTALPHTSFKQITTAPPTHAFTLDWR